jgi:Cof subfamily protein (haloacid dehalogenase superfamily)
MEKLKLVLCDIDGTIVNEAREFSDLTRTVMQRLHKNGVRLGIASGRTVDDIKHSTSGWNLGFDWDVCIGLNGIELWDGIQNQYHHFYDMEPAVIKEAMDEFAKEFEYNPFIYRNNVLISGKPDPIMEMSAVHAGMKHEVAKDLSVFWAEPTSKVMLRIKDENVMPLMEKYVEEHPSPNYKAFKTQPTLLEVCDRRVSKALPFEMLCAENDFEIENIAAFGDTSNDNEMLKAAGLGVCLLNGSDDTKACADMITEIDNENDGWAHFMLKHFPEETKE